MALVEAHTALVEGQLNLVGPWLGSDLTQTTFQGVTFLDLCISNVVERHPEVSRTVGRGSMFAYADSKAILAQMNSDGRLRIYLAFRQPEGSVLAELGGADASPDTKRNLLLAKFYGWAEWLLDIIRACDDEAFIERAINTLPTGWISGGIGPQLCPGRP